LKLFFGKDEKLKNYGWHFGFTESVPSIGIPSDCAEIVVIETLTINTETAKSSTFFTYFMM
jgi:hypothetical protein